MTTDSEKLCFGCSGHVGYIKRAANQYMDDTVDGYECKTVPVKGIATCPCIKCIVKTMCSETCLLFKTYFCLKSVTCYSQSY